MTTLIAGFRAFRADVVFASRSEIAGRAWPIQPGADNAGWASGFQFEHHRPGVPDPVRSAFLMKSVFLIVLSILPFSLIAELPSTHPLRHPKLAVVYQPSGNWQDGWVYVHEVVAYILRSDDERTAARAILEREGYGPKGRHYLYCGEFGKPAVADGQPFKTREKAMKYLKEKKVEVAYYFSLQSSFPATIPGEITYDGTAFRVLDRFK